MFCADKLIAGFLFFKLFSFLILRSIGGWVNLSLIVELLFIGKSLFMLSPLQYVPKLTLFWRERSSAGQLSDFFSIEM